MARSRTLARRAIQLPVMGSGGAPAISVSPASWNAGVIPVGDPATQNFEITGDVIITAINLPAGFSHDAVLPWTVIDGVDDTFNVTADADDDGIFSGDMEIISDGNPSPLLVALDVDVSATLYSDEFTDTVAAPIPAGNADTRGYRVFNDVEALMTQSGGALNVPAQASAVWGDEYYRAQPSVGQQYWERPSGKALVAVTTFNQSTRADFQAVGWWNTATLDASQVRSLYTSTTAIRSIVSGAAVSDSQPHLVSTDYSTVAVWDSTGFHIFVKILGIWHKKWFAPTVLSQAYCGMSNLSAAGSLKSFKIFAIDESLFAPALSIANPSVGNLADMPDGDFLLYLDNITIPSAATMRWNFRKKDSSNYWQQTCSNAGISAIVETVVGTPTTRSSGSGVVSTDDIITIARAQTMQAWRNTTALGSAYTSAYNFLREVGLELNSLGTGGAIGALYAWKARLLDETGLGSDVVVNGDFVTDTVWTKGTGWTISAGAAHKAAGTDSNLAQGSILTIGKYYELTFTISNYSAGTLSPFIGGATLASVNANGTYTVKSVASSSATLAFIADATFAGSIDNVSCKEIQFTADSLATVLDGLAA